MKKFTPTFFSVIIIVWALDFASKQWALGALEAAGYVPVLGSLLGWELTYNTGGVFGIFQGNAMIFQVITGLAIVFLLLFYARGVSAEENTRLFQLAMSFVLGGALGNFTDRFYKQGVVDFINMGIGSHRWPTYNVADAFISVGAILLLVSFILFEKKQRRATKKQSSEKTEAPRSGN